MTTGRILARIVDLDAPVGESELEFYKRTKHEARQQVAESAALIRHYIATERAALAVIRHQLAARGLPAELDDAIVLIEDELQAQEEES